MRDAFKDFSHAARLLWNALPTTLVIIGTLGIAIAGSTVIFSVIDMATHIIPTDRQDLVFVASTDSRLSQAQAGVSNGVARAGVSVPDLLDWTAQTTTFDQLSGFTFGSATLTGAGVAVQVSTISVTPGFFEQWGIQPNLGRDFAPEEFRVGASSAAMITDDFWQSQFSRDPAVLGRSVRLNGQQSTIVGVLPSEVGAGIFKGRDLFVPLLIDPSAARDQRNLFVTGRLKSGVNAAQGEQDLAAIVTRLQSEYPRTNAGIGVVVRPLLELVGGNTPVLLFLIGLMAVLLLAIACANLANIQLAQLGSRRREFAVRAALGASQLDLVRPVLYEGLICSTLAGLCGLVLAFLGLQAIRFAAGEFAVGFNEVALNWRVVLVTVASAFAAPVLFALLPAWKASSTEPELLKSGARAVGELGRHKHARHVFIAAQVACALILSVQVVAIVQAAWAVHNLPLGFDPANVLTFRVDLDRTRYAESSGVHQFYDEFIRRIEGLPGISSAARTVMVPIVEQRDTSLEIRGDETQDVSDRPVAIAGVGINYFSTMRIPVIRGRELTLDDIANKRPVVLVSQEAARRYWPNADAIGQQISSDALQAPGEWFEIVGIVGNVRNSNADLVPQPQMYFPVSWDTQPSAAFVVRTPTSDPAQLVPSIRNVLGAMDAELALDQILTMDDVLYHDLAGTYLLGGILAALGVIAVCLASAGVYGVVRYSATNRTHEIGLRMALGATSWSVIRLILREGAIPMVLGAVPAVFAASRLLRVTESVLGGTTRTSELTLIVTVGGLFFIGLAAAFGPARKASHVDPAVALRKD